MNKNLLIKVIYISFFIINNNSITGQTTLKINFESQILNYKPVKKSNISEKNYKRAINILNQTIIAVDGKVENFNVADYWNITVAFLLLNESKEKVEIAFIKGIKTDRKMMCTYTQLLYDNGKRTYNRFFQIIPESFNKFIQSCEKFSEDLNDSNEYVEIKNSNTPLIELFDRIIKNDQKYRKEGLKYYKQHLFEQQRLDSTNLKIIDSIYQKHHKYIGKSIVGEELQVVMWAVIQHSNIKKMKEYLPIIQKAVKEKELKIGPLKMLIDRIYHIEYGYQIFGSQGGVPIADDRIRLEVAKKYYLKI